MVGIVLCLQCTECRYGEHRYMSKDHILNIRLVLCQFNMDWAATYEKDMRATPPMLKC